MFGAYREPSCVVCCVVSTPGTRDTFPRITHPPCDTSLSTGLTMYKHIRHCPGPRNSAYFTKRGGRESETEAGFETLRANVPFLLLILVIVPETRLVSRRVISRFIYVINECREKLARDRFEADATTLEFALVPLGNA